MHQYSGALGNKAKPVLSAYPSIGLSFCISQRCQMSLSLQPEYKASLAGIQAVVQFESSGPLEREGPYSSDGSAFKIHLNPNIPLQCEVYTV